MSLVKISHRRHVIEFLILHPGCVIALVTNHCLPCARFLLSCSIKSLQPRTPYVPLLLEMGPASLLENPTFSKCQRAGFWMILM